MLFDWCYLTVAISPHNLFKVLLKSQEFLKNLPSARPILSRSISFSSIWRPSYQVIRLDWFSTKWERELEGGWSSGGEVLGAITEVWLKAVGAFLGPNRGCRRLGGNGGVARKTLGIPIFHFDQTKFSVKPFVWAGYLIWASYPQEGFPPLSCG